MFWSDSMQKLVRLISRKGEVTRKSQDIYDSGVRWYMITTKLKNKDIIYEKGRDDYNRKIWCLTEKGEELAEYIKKILKILGE